MFIVLLMMFYLKIQAKLINGSKLKRWTALFSSPMTNFHFTFFPGNWQKYPIAIQKFSIRRYNAKQ